MFLEIKEEKWSKEKIKERMLMDDEWLTKGILEIFRLQTEDEQKEAETKYTNNIGFSAADGRYFTIIVNQIKKEGRIHPKEVESARKRMAKYAGQLLKVANGDI